MSKKIFKLFFKSTKVLRILSVILHLKGGNV